MPEAAWIDQIEKNKKVEQNFSKENGFIPVFLLLPQKDDILFIRKKGQFYDKFVNAIKGKVATIDLTEDLLEWNDLDNIYSDDNEYGGHLSREGNKELASIIYPELDRIIDKVNN